MVITILENPLNHSREKIGEDAEKIIENYEFTNERVEKYAESLAHSSKTKEDLTDLELDHLKCEVKTLEDLKDYAFTDKEIEEILINFPRNDIYTLEKANKARKKSNKKPKDLQMDTVQYITAKRPTTRVQ